MQKSAFKTDVKLKISRETLRVLESAQLLVAGNAEESATIRYSNCGSCNTGIDGTL